MKKPLVVILAGGIGKAFKPLTLNKTLIPIMGKPILQHIIEMVEAADFNEALIVTNDENESWLSSYQPFNITLQTQLVKPTGMGDALLQSTNVIRNDPILVMNACDIIEPHFFKQLSRETLDTYAYVTGLQVDTYFPGGYIKREGSRAVEIVEKPGDGQAPSDLLNLVFHYFSEPEDLFSILRTMPTSDDQYEKAVTELMKQREIKLVEYRGPWQKLKYAPHILDMMMHLMKLKKINHIARSAFVSRHALIEGDVFIDEDAHIDDFAVIKGPVYIGRRARVGSHTLVRQSTIEEDAVVGFGSEVARSYVGPRCKLHQNFVGDTVLESDINPSWGTTFANWRFDGSKVKLKLPDEIRETGREKLGAIVAKDAFLGVNCSVMPGVTIGKKARIYPGKVVIEAVKEGEMVK